MLGCICVVIAGALAFFNFSHGFELLPSPENLQHFLKPDAGSWPLGRSQGQAEETAIFYKRVGKKISRTRSWAIRLAVASAVCFVLGAASVLRVVAL